MIKTVSIDMSTCDEDSENRIFGKVIEQEGDNLICEFDSANYDFKQENVIKQLKDKEFKEMSKMTKMNLRKCE